MSQCTGECVSRAKSDEIVAGFKNQLYALQRSDRRFSISLTDTFADLWHFARGIEGNIRLMESVGGLRLYVGVLARIIEHCDARLKKDADDYWAAEHKRTHTSKLAFQKSWLEMLERRLVET
jgi:hypothetical protein